VSAVRAADKPVPVLRVTGSARLEATPDELRVSFAVISQDASVDRAMRDNSRRTTNVLEALRRAGVEDADLETAGFTVQPEFDHAGARGGRAPKIVGYTVRNTVTATTTDLTLAGELIEKSVDAGADSVSGVVFGLADPQAHRARAIAEATAHARADAEALAAAAGLSLAGVVEITLDPQGGGYRPYTQPYGLRGMAADAVAAPPLQPGGVTLSARVQMVYAVGARH